MQNILEPEIIEPGIKRVLVKFAGGRKQPQEVLIGPGTTSLDLFQHLGLNGKDFQLSKGTPDTVFGTNEILYSRISDGDLLFVAPLVDAGN